jgi:hypothetical protein
MLAIRKYGGKVPNANLVLEASSLTHMGTKGRPLNKSGSAYYTNGGQHCVLISYTKSVP